MTEFDKSYYGQLKSNFDRAVNHIIGNAEDLRRDSNERDRSQFELILTYNNLVIYVNNHLPYLYTRTQRGIGATIQTARDRIEYCSKRLKLTIVLPKNLFDRIESDLFDLSMDKIPDDFEISNNTSESLERTNIDGLNSENMNNSLNLARYSTPVRNQRQLSDMAAKPVITTMGEQIPESNHIPTNNINDNITVSTTKPMESNPTYTTAQIQTGTQMNVIPTLTQSHQQRPTMTTNQNMNNIPLLNNTPINQIRNIDNCQPIIYTNQDMNMHDGSPLNQMPHQHNESMQRTQGIPNNNTYNPFLPQQFSTQYNQPYQNQTSINEYHGIIMRSNQVLEQQANQLQQAARFNETLMNELRIQRESYHQLLNNQMTNNQNNTHSQQQTGTKQKIRPEYREILRSIPDFDGEKYRDLDNILHAAELAYYNADNMDELGAFYLTLKLHLKGHVYKTIYSDTTQKTWEEIKKILNTEFSYLKPDKGLIKKQLETARQLETENIDTFAKRILTYANQKRSSYNSFTKEQEDDLNDQMIRTFTGGIKTEKIKNKLSFFGSDKFFDYVTRAIDLERNVETEILNREFYCNYCNKNGHREATCRLKQEQTSGLSQLSKLFGNLTTKPKNTQFTPNGNQNQSQNTNQPGRNQIQNNTNNYRGTTNTGVRNNIQNNQGRSINAANDDEANVDNLNNTENSTNNEESDSESDSEN